jgi:hypothetical protein
LKIDVRDWANYGKGKKKSPAANSKYRYNWAFEKPDQFIRTFVNGSSFERSR